ncbi:MAG: DNA-directed RNA polymerase subunit beta' [bacterium]|nr:DNA-directed RNA polymerase subunit beta' [bacterium]
MEQKNLNIPNLLKVQIEPYKKFLQKDVPPEKREITGLEEVLRKVFPETEILPGEKHHAIASDDGTLFLEYISYSIEDPVESETECVDNGTTYGGKFKVRFRLYKKDKLEERIESFVEAQDVYLGLIPLMTERGTFIINGIERTVVNQIQRSPGVYFKEEEEISQRATYSARIFPARGLWLEFHPELHHNVTCLYAYFGKKKIYATTLLKALGYSSEKIISILYDSPDDIPPDSIIKNTLEKDADVQTQEEAIKKIYAELRPGFPMEDKEAKLFFRRLFFSSEQYDLSPAGRLQINKKRELNRTEVHLTAEDIIKTLKYLLNLTEKNQGETDDIDHLGNKRVRTSAELVKEHVYEGLVRLAHFVKERMAIIDKTMKITPQDILNSRIFSTAVEEFFARNQLSQFLDQINPLAELTHKRRLTAVGEGGVKERKRAGFEVRDVHYTHFGRICPIETPEGANVGLINSLTIYSDVDKNGFLRTPYFRVNNGKILFNEVVYVSADEEDNYVVAPPDVPYDPETGEILLDVIRVRSKGGEFTETTKDKIELIGVSPKQVVGLSASLIPFLEHNDSNRALMGSNMQRQAVPLLRPERPLVRTGMERKVVVDSGVVLRAKHSGVVEYVDAKTIIVNREKKGIFPWEEKDVYHLQTFRRTNQDTCFHQRPLVSAGEKVKEGQIISDGPAVSPEGDLALGRNLLVAFMPWRGYNFEDAIILSERLVKEDTFTSIHIEKFEVTAQDTERGPEEITADLPNVSEEELRNLDKNGIIRIGAEVKPGDILVGKITPKGEAELTPEEKLLRVIFGEKARDVANTSLIVPPGVYGVVINVKTYYPSDRIPEQQINEQLEKIEKELKAKKNTVRKIITDKIKDILSYHKISSTRLTSNPESWERVVRSIDKDDIRSEVKRIVDIGKEELERLEREAKNEEIKIRKGSELEPNVICKVSVEIATKKKVAVGDKMSGRHGNKGVISIILPEEDMPFLEDGTPVDIILNPLGVPSRMNIGQVLETHLGWALRTLGYSIETPVFESIKEIEIKHKLKEAGLPEEGKTRVYDGQTGEPFLQPVTVGYIYMMKLIHLADEKFHARSVGSYSLITQQPLGGRAQFGGQRFGEMEVWALEGYGASYTLREMLTIKSDDIKGRKKAYESIVKGVDYQEENLPESFHVLTKELNGLGFDIRVEKRKKNGEDRDVVTIRIAPPMVIRSWSYGEVKKAETLNYRTNKPERDGLFCEKIFGPVKDWECACGKFKKQRFRGIICDRCGVEVTTSEVRRERMGHIELATPVSYVWLFKSTANWLGVLLDVSHITLEKVLYYDRYIVVDAGDTPLGEKQLLTEDEYKENLEKYGNRFRAEIGAAAIYELLKKIDLEKEMEKIKDELKNKKKKKDSGYRRNLVKKLRMIEGLLKTEVKPEYLITSIIPVIPPDLRPLLPLDGGKFVASDLNDLYQRVINRNNRLKKLIKLQAPDIIIRNEKRMLQEAVDALLDNGRYGTPVLGKGKRPLKSLSESLRGKQGRFRQNLLGKRVDYSGRAVIVVDPTLKLHECGIPKQMALELFSPFVLRELRKKEYFHTLGSAKRALEENRPEVWEILEKVTKNHPVLLNRQPTLHRLSVQAFDPRLMEGNVIRIHPLVCTAFNADFDGDTMSVHVPITVEAQLEAELLMKSSLHILSPANGRPIVTPTRDIVLGCYYLTYQSEQSIYGDKKYRDHSHKHEAIYSFEEAEILYEFGLLELHRPIRVRDKKGQVFITTAGKILFNKILPSEIAFQNRLINIEALEQLIKKIFTECGYSRTVQFLDDVKELGFTYATIGGLSIGIDDLKVPEIKKRVIEETRKEVARIDRDYRAGLISEGERYNRIIDLWTSVTNRISNEVFETLRKDVSIEPFRINSLIMMVESGARGNRSQVNQLAGMRGLMIRPTKKATGGMGEIITTPVIANFREGLPLLEYFISIHGGRKGVVDTALKTSDAGYLSRRLVDVAHSVIVTTEDCGTTDGIYISALTDGEKVIIPLKDRIVGRVAFDQIVDIISDEVLVRSGEIIDEDKAERIADLGVERIKIRSVLTCKAERGVCAKCYGADLSRQKLVNLGEAVGVVAAQSIGEPGTQLTLRTFHVGGTVTRSIGPARIIAQYEGVVRYSENLKFVTNRNGKMIVLSREGTIDIEDEERGRKLDSYPVIVGTELHVESGKKVKKGEVLATWDPYAIPIIAEKSGIIKFRDIIPGKTIKEDREGKEGIIKRTVIEHEDTFEPRIEILEEFKAKENCVVKLSIGETDKSLIGDKEIQEHRNEIILQFGDGKEERINIPTFSEVLVKNGDTVKKNDIILRRVVSSHYLAVNTNIIVEDGNQVFAGDVIAKTPKVVGRVQDITGGLPRVSELFEARPPRNPAILSEVEGDVLIEQGERGTKIIKIIDSSTREVKKEYRVPLGKHLLVGNGDHVVSGSKLTDGPAVLTDILKTQGEKKVQEYLLNEIQKVYRVEGVNINDKHMEIIIRQMLSRVRVTDPGDTYLLEGEEVDRIKIQQINDSLQKGKKRAKYEPLILGITRVALSSESFISAASFQETLKVITNAAITGAEDYLEGLKENVILGKLIPAGTGFFSGVYKKEEQTTEIVIGGE